MRYEVKAVGPAGQVEALALEASDAHDASLQAQGQGYAVLGVKAAAGWSLRRGASFPLVLFSQELLALLEAGLSLVEGLETLADKERQPEVRKALRHMLASLYEGHPLSYAVEHAPVRFPVLYVATIRASEKTGGLPEALARYISYQSQVDAVRRQVVSASIYPLLLAGVGVLVTAFLLGYVVPRFSHVYAEMGTDLPMLSRWLMAWGQALEAHGALIAAALALAAGAAAYGASRSSTRRWLLYWVWQLPGVRHRLHVFQLARFYRSLGMLLRGGMPVLASLGLVAGLLDPQVRTQLALASQRISEGQPLSGAMEQHGFTTPVASRMLRVGERTGRMGEMMERIASFHEEETARWVAHFTRLFEPLLMVLIGVVVGGIVVLMYFPIFELAGSIQ